MSRYQEYIHASQHAGMGCGPMSSCAVCKAQGFGDAATTGAISFDFGIKDILKIAMVATVSTIVAETVLKPFVIPRIRKLIGERPLKACINPLASEKEIKADARKILEYRYGLPATRFSQKQRDTLRKLEQKVLNERLSYTIYPAWMGSPNPKR